MTADDSPTLLDYWYEVLVYPSRQPALAFVLGIVGVIAGLDLFGLFMPAALALAWGILSFALTVMVWLALYRYASEILVATARGAADPPEMVSMDAADRLAFRHVLLWILATLVVVALAVTGSGPFWLVTGCVVVAAVLPAATVVLTLTGSLLEGVNPARWWALVRGTGHDYEVAAGWLVLLGLVYLMADIVSARLGWLGDAVMIGVWGWGLLGWFHLLGRLVHQHAGELGLADDGSEWVEAEEPVDTPAVNENPAALHERIRCHGGTREEHDSLHAHLRRAGKAGDLVAHARDYIPALLYSHEDPDRALDIAEHCLDADPGFCLANPAHMRDLVHAAAERERVRDALRLIGAFAETHAGHRLQPDVELAGCRLLVDQPGEARHAGRWLRRLAGMDLDANQKNEVRRLLERLNSPGGSGSSASASRR